MCVYLTTFYTAQYNQVKQISCVYCFINNLHRVNIYNLNSTKWLIIHLVFISPSKFKHSSIHKRIFLWKAKCLALLLSLRSEWYLTRVLMKLRELILNWNGSDAIAADGTSLTSDSFIINWMSHTNAKNYVSIDVDGVGGNYNLCFVWHSQRRREDLSN